MPRLSARLAYLLLGLTALAFAAYGSLLPFDFHLVPFEDAAARFAGVLRDGPVRRVSRTDLLANVLLFVPVGFGLAGALLVDRRPQARVLPGLFLIAAITLTASTLIEFSQLYARDRIPSRVDIAAQSAGSAIGLLIWLIAGARLTGWLRESGTAAPDDRLERLLLAYTCGWVFVSLAPFDLTLDVGQLGRRLRDGRIAPIPFLEPDVLSVRWLWDAAAEILAAVPLGVYGRALTRRGPARLAAVFGLAAATEFAQIFIRSHAALASDVLFAWVGLGIGVLGSARLTRAGRRPPLPVSAPASSGRLDVGALAILCGWALVVCAYHWQPFDFAVDAEAVRRKVSRLSLVPFAAYRSGSYLNAFNTALAKVAIAIPLGILARGVLPAAGRTPAVLALWVLALTAVAALAEVGQFFLPTRYPDPTDVLLASLAAWLGLVLGFWLRPGPSAADRAGDRS